MVFRLSCAYQTYDWGKLGSNSKVGGFLKSSCDNNVSLVDESKPYAELWMGTHPSGPSKLYSSNTTLEEAIKDLKLPFLFKVLSIGKALSIQAHPDKTLAAKLHSQFPNIYKDDNHKPEMSIALTEFEALCGFRPWNEIAENLKLYRPFKELLGEELASAFLSSDPKNENECKKALKAIFVKLMNTDQNSVTLYLQKMLKEAPESELTNLLRRLNSEYPNDVGCFCALLLNYIKLMPGDAFFMAANEPHAYLSGDCIECMAASDNVVRSGLTPKLKDVATLTEMLTYTSKSAKDQLLKPIKCSSLKFTMLFDPPIDEFSVLQTIIPPQETETFKGIDGPAICIAIKGEGLLNGEPVGEGFVFYIAPGTKFTIGNVGDEEFVAYTAFCSENAP